MHGYSSSSESDDEYNYRKNKGTVPAAANSNDANKKKKKRKLPPQQTINRIWKRFSNKKFNKALAVLPFDPVLPPAISDRSNELLISGYERAAEECRRKVKKIIQECRRVNMRYRDPGWDIDWDLKMEKGNCLNSLGRSKFDISMSTLLNPSAVVPKAVKRVHEIFEKPTFMEKLSGSDVKQGNLGDCWLMASLSGLANVRDGIKRICVEYDTRIGIYGFVFYRDGEWIYSIVDDKLYLKSPCWDSPSMQRDLLQQIDREDVERVYRKTYQTGSKALFFAQCKDQNETWLPLIEKAYAKAHGDYASLSGGWIGEGLEDLSGGVTTEILASDILDLDGFWDNELSRVNEEFLFGCSTGLLDGGYGDREGISEGHAYVVMEARTLKNGTRLLKLRNPWGKTKKGIWEGAWSDGSKEWTTEAQEELGHQFGSDSVFWISYEDLLRKYQHFDRTRLFRDPDWRCCQRWIGVEVPWKPQYNEKFHIKLTRESPLVLVLSQLDNRYFKGLHGQYSFRLHFRLHEIDRPNPEDYIVRSHGNYLMDRSVSIELPSMLPGRYSVFISVVGERDTDVPSIENVVKRECKKRVENEKLAQVGYAYDLAHSKAAAHLEAVKNLRKKADQKKASEARVKERRRLWEKRHLNRDITKKQGRKNNEKLEARQAAREERRRKQEALQEELRPKDQAIQTEEPPKVEEANKKKAADDSKPNDEKKDNNQQPKEASVSEEGKKEENEDKAEEKKKEESKEDPEPVKDTPQVNVQHPSDDDTPEDTPVPTPAVTPSIEKTEEEASGLPREEAKEETAEAKSDEKGADTSSDKVDGTPEDKSEEKPDNNSKDHAGDVPSAGSSVSSGSPKLTPRSDRSATPVDEEEDKEKAPDSPVETSAVSDAPPAPPADPPTTTSSTTTTATNTGTETPKPAPVPAPEKAPEKAPAPAAAAAPAQPKTSDKAPAPPKKRSNLYVTSDGESSASPIEDWEELYSSDDMTRKPRMAAPPAPGTAMVSKYRDDTDDENDPDPWNAICVVGLRVYSKDEDLELRVVMEGGELEEGGMGEKGGVDLDNAQANAGGARGKKKEDGGYEGDSEDGKGGGKSDAESAYPVMVQRGKGEDEYESAVESQRE
ncbi:hypothetical protein B0T22DRAFT_485253 [Podospora appendiculata]|uniref:Calpain catalytic domain-containing protein n=1 Tax=Podospora appendiculata TaxID=314037 RepID=A0AAE0X0K7_9PEZI|nr:hypothetical protein B0T22DRAFT_485253 [Podospora appendiculata]